MMDRKAMMDKVKMKTMQTNSDQLRREREAYMYAFGLAEEVITEEVCQNLETLRAKTPAKRQETIGQLFAAALEEGLKTYPPGIFTSGRVVARAPFFPDDVDYHLDPPRPAAPPGPPGHTTTADQWGDGSKPLPVASVAAEPPAAKSKKRGRPSSSPTKPTQADKADKVVFTGHSLFSKLVMPGVIADMKKKDDGVGADQRLVMVSVNTMWHCMSTAQKAIFAPEALAVKEHHKRFKQEVATNAIKSGVASELNLVNAKLNAMYFGCPKGQAKGLTAEEKTAYYKQAMPDGADLNNLVLVSEMNPEQIHLYIKSLPGKPAEPATEEEAIAAAATTDQVVVDSTVIVNGEIVPDEDARNKGNVLEVAVHDL